MDVSIRQLKARLAPARRNQHVEVPPALEQLIVEGRATASQEAFIVVPVQPAKVNLTWQEILDEDRGD